MHKIFINAKFWGRVYNNKRLFLWLEIMISCTKADYENCVHSVCLSLVFSCVDQQDLWRSQENLAFISWSQVTALWVANLTDFTSTWTKLWNLSSNFVCFVYGAVKMIQRHMETVGVFFLSSSSFLVLVFWFGLVVSYRGASDNLEFCLREKVSIIHWLDFSKKI